MQSHKSPHALGVRCSSLYRSPVIPACLAKALSVAAELTCQGPWRYVSLSLLLESQRVAECLSECLKWMAEVILHMT